MKKTILVSMALLMSQLSYANTSGLVYESLGLTSYKVLDKVCGKPKVKSLQNQVGVSFPDGSGGNNQLKAKGTIEIGGKSFEISMIGDRSREVTHMELQVLTLAIASGKEVCVEQRERYTHAANDNTRGLELWGTVRELYIK